MQSVANLRNDLQRQPGIERSGLEKLPQVGAVHVFHEKIEMFARLAEVMHGHDVRMTEPSQSASFPREPLGERRIAAPLRR